MAGEASGGAAAGGSAGAVNPGVAPGAAPAPAAAAAAPAAGAGDWTTGLTEEHKGFVENKGWKKPSDVVESYRNFEKLQGVPQDQILRLPKTKDAPEDQAGWEGVYTKLGKPAKPEGYGFKEGDENFNKWASETFHKNNLSESQAQNLLKAFNENSAAQKTAEKEALAAKTDEQALALKKEWGAAFEQNLNAAKRAVREFGVDPKALDALDAAIGHDKTMKFFSQLGSKLGEATFHGGDSNSAGGNRARTPEQAKARFNELKSDPGWVKKFASGDQSARAEKAKLDLEMIGEAG